MRRNRGVVAVILALMILALPLAEAFAGGGGQKTMKVGDKWLFEHVGKGPRFYITITFNSHGHFGYQHNHLTVYNSLTGIKKKIVQACQERGSAPRAFYNGKYGQIYGASKWATCTSGEIVVHWSGFIARTNRR